MAKKINTTMLGIFVLGATALALAAIVLFGSGKWFKPISRFVIYFPESVQGLKVGADVVTHGVKIGSVVDVKAVFVPSEKKIRIPVYIEVDRARIENLMLPADTIAGQQQNLLNAGLEAQLITESLVTGQRAVALSFTRKNEAVLVGLDTSLPEIPSQASSLEKLTSELERISLDQVVNRIDRTLSAIENATAEFPAIIKTAQQKLDSFNSAEISNKLERSLNALEKTLNNFDNQSKPVQHNINNTLNEIAAAAREFRQLAELLQRHPESLLKGKK